MATSQVKCWNCGLLYNRVFDRCPTDILGCGASKEPVMDEIEIARREAMVAYKAMFRLISAARRSGYTHTTDASRRASAALVAVVDAIDLIVTSLRNDKTEQRDAADSEGVQS